MYMKGTGQCLPGTGTGTSTDDPKEQRNSWF